MKRTRAWSLIPLCACIALAPIGSGCNNNNSGNEGGTPNPDMSAPLPDMTLVPDMTQTGPTPDLITVTNSGTALLLDVQGPFPIPMGDAGVVPVVAHSLLPVVTFGPNVTHDFDNRNGGLIGCFADHYDLASPTGKKPSPDVNDGTVTFSGYAGGTLINGMTAPPQIDCTQSMTTGMYGCGYGMNGMAVTGNPGAIPYAPGVSPITAGMKINVSSTGGTVFGTFNAMTAAAANPVAVMENLNATGLYSPTADTTFHIYCPGDGGSPGNAMCATSPVLLVTLVGSQLPVTDPNYPGTAYAVAACVQLALGNTFTIKKEVIAALLGPSPTTITQIQTRIGRGNQPPTVMDSKGNSITVAVATGVFGFAPYP